MFAPLQVRDFRYLFVGLLLGQAMMPLQFVTQIFWVQEHASPGLVILLVGLIGTIRGFGAITFGLFGGALADRYDRRRVLLATQSGALLVTLAIALVMLVGEGSVGAFVAFFALSVLASACWSIDLPTRQAIVPEILGPRLTPGGIALLQAGSQAAFPISLFAAGLLVDALGFASTFALSGAGFVIVILALLGMQYRTDFSGRTALRPFGFRNTCREVREGMHYARQNRTVLWVIVLMVSSMALVTAATANLGVTWVSTVVEQSRTNTSFIAMAWGSGVFLMALAQSRFAHVDHKGRLVALGSILYVGSFVVFASGHTVPFAVVGWFGVGAGMSLMLVSAISLVQLLIGNEVRGRVMSLVQLNQGVAQLMTLPVAALAQAVSLETLFPILAVVAVAIVALILVSQPHLWRARVSEAQHEAGVVQVGAALAPQPAVARDPAGQRD